MRLQILWAAWLCFRAPVISILSYFFKCPSWRFAFRNTELQNSGVDEIRGDCLSCIGTLKDAADASMTLTVCVINTNGTMKLDDEEAQVTAKNVTLTRRFWLPMTLTQDHKIADDLSTAKRDTVWSASRCLLSLVELARFAVEFG